MPEEMVQDNPQKGLGDQICTNTCEQDGPKRFLMPNGICNGNCTLSDDREKKSGDQFFLERRARKTINPISRPNPIKAQRHATSIVPVRGKISRLNCASTSKSSGRTVTVYLDSN